MQATPADYDAALKTAVLFDLADHGKIELTGPDALTFLHNLCTNDIKSLPPGGGCEAFLCNATARTLAHVLVSRLTNPKETLLLDMVPGLADKVYRHLDKYLVSEQVEIAERTKETALLRLCGPKSASVLETVLGDPVPELPLLHHISRQVAAPAGSSAWIHVRRQDVLGLPGFDLFCAAQDAGFLREKLLTGGVTVGSKETHEILRIEAGTPVYDQDMNDERFVVEVGRTAQAICYTKGCYLGQEPVVMARDRGQVNRTLLGIKVAQGDPLPPASRLFQGKTEVGQVTSSIYSPRLGQVIALAYLRRGNQQPGTELVVDPATDGRKAVVASLPFLA